MGWKASCIFVKPVNNEPHESLLRTLGASPEQQVGLSTYEEAMNPNEGLLYVGKYKDMLVICSHDLPFDFYNVGSLSSPAQKLLEQYPDSEVLVFTLQSVVNHYGYAFYKGKKLLRMKVGDCDQPLGMEYGEPLEEEAELYQHVKKGENGENLFFYEGIDHPYQEDQVGENFVFNLTARFLGEPLDSAGNDFLFGNAFLTKYDLSIPLSAPAKDAQPAATQQYNQAENENLLQEVIDMSFPKHLLTEEKQASFATADLVEVQTVEAPQSAPTASKSPVAEPTPSWWSKNQIWVVAALFILIALLRFGSKIFR